MAGRREASGGGKMPPSPFLDLLCKILAGAGVAVLFSLAIFVHELGHFLAARRLGLVVDAFSLGFGPAIWKRRIGGVEYRVGCIPVGGYVALPQIDPAGMAAIQGEHGPEPAGGEDRGDGRAVSRPLPDVAPWRRIVVSLAGPLGNVLLAVLLAWAIYLAPDTGLGGADTTVGYVATNSPAFAAGLRPGDRILAINRNRVANWNEFIIECHLSGDAVDGLAVEVQRGSERLTLRLPVARDEDGGFVTVPGVAPREICVVGAVVSNSPAARAGLQPGDRLLAIDGLPPAGPADVIARVAAHGERPLTLTLQRDGRLREVVVTPRHSPELDRPLIGIEFAVTAYAPQWLQYRRPMRQIANDAKAVARVLRALLAPRARGEARRAVSGLSGPLAIVVLLWYQVRTGLIVALAFLRFLCVNLALINLLPLPVLDGGHILFALWEMAVRRKPHPQVVNWLANVFALLLIGLMVLLVYRDARSLHRLFGRRAGAAEEAGGSDTPPTPTFPPATNAAPAPP